VPTAAPLIVIENISKEYRGKGGAITRALDNISLRIDKGEFVSLVGPSGAGKSTLMRLLIAEERPSRGRIIIAGRDLRTLRSRDIPFYRRKVGVVFQDFKLLPTKTVAENIAFALEVCDATPAEVREKVPKILELVGLSHRAGNEPDELSGGETQRVAIARALIHAPKLLIADEPTGNLDPANTWEIIELLLKINQTGTIVLLATHNQPVVDRLQRRVVALQEGKLVSDQKNAGYTEVKIKESAKGGA
jgi:cell division transport system ATP-binding protein